MNHLLAVLALAVPATIVAPPAAKRAPPNRTVDLLLTADGPVPGLPGYQLTRVKDARYCGGTHVMVKRPKKRPTIDAKLAAVFDLDYPTGLNFDPDPKKAAQRKKSLDRFTDWVTRMMKAGRESSEHYGALMSATSDAEAKFAALARVTQGAVQFAIVLTDAEIPKDVRTGEFASEKTEAFCEKLVEIAKPMVEQARSSLEQCRVGAAQFPTAWWVAVCGP